MPIRIGWAGPDFHPLHREHVVQLYREDNQLTETVASYALDAFNQDHAVLFVATRHHCRRFRAALELRGVDVRAAVDRGQLSFVTVEDVLPKVMREGEPDKAQFERLVRTLLSRCRRDGRFRHVHVYGELVNTLWKQGHVGATLRLEQLWNDLRKVEPFTLYCGYHVDEPTADAVAHKEIPLREHTRLVDTLPPDGQTAQARAVFVELADLVEGDARELASALRGLQKVAVPDL